MEPCGTLRVLFSWQAADTLPHSPTASVYKSGFATTQEAYESNVKPLHASLSKLEGILKGKDYLIGDRLTEADM